MTFKLEQEGSVRAISEFRGQWAPLSNFYQCKFKWNGHEWPTAEHAFQAAKCVNESDLLEIKAAISPGFAKRLGRQVELRDDWEERKIDFMRSILDAKFEVSSLRRVLMRTGDHDLVEGNTWGDRFWGVCKGRGQNHLGKLLMETRSRIRELEMERAPSEGLAR